MHPAASAGIPYPGPRMGDASPVHEAASPGTLAEAPSIARQTVQMMPAPQTLLQPDLPKNLILFKKVPVPLVVLWSPEKPAPIKKIVAPLPDAPAIAVTRASLDIPINEESLAEFRVSSSPLVSQVPVAPPSTTSPIIVHGPEQARKVPQTTSRQPDPTPPTPARILSLSDIRVPEGKVVVPTANESDSKMGKTVPGQLKDQMLPIGTEKATGKSSGSGAGKGSGEHAEKTAPTSSSAHADNGGQSGKDSGSNALHKPDTETAAAPTQAKVWPASQNSAATGQAPGAAVDQGTANQPSSVHISLPKDGQFGVVVTGSSISDKYPETAELWSGRMAATVYLRVGMPKSWILQYALPRLVDAAFSGSSGHVEAPWPYEIARPNLDSADFNSDALILHGFVNKDGRFEKLEVVFPGQFVQAGMVLSQLNAWQFRPAKLNGILTAVEVMLIIPDQSE